MDNIVYGIHAVQSLLETQPDNISKLFVQRHNKGRRVRALLDLAKKYNITVAPLEAFNINQDIAHQGVIAQLTADINLKTALKEPDLPEFLEKLFKNKPKALILILDGVKDPHNLGACFRTADAAGVDLIIAPKDRSVGITPVVRKVACGAAEIVPFVQITNLARVMKELKDLGVWIFGTADEESHSIFDTNFSEYSDQPIALVLGSEDKGLRRLTRENCDALLAIPLHGSVSSLNVSVATGVCLFEIVRQRG